MKRVFVAGLLCLIVSSSHSLGQQQPTCSSCDVVTQAVKDYHDLKPGMKRSEIEKNFELDGGLSVRPRANYIYRNCRYIKVAIEFNLDPKAKEAFSPNDTIKNLSKLFVDYPVMD